MIEHHRDCRKIDPSKGAWLGDGTPNLAERNNPPARCLVTLVVEAGDADVWADEPIWIDGSVKGFCTSGGYSHYAEKSIALALVPREAAKPGLEVEIEILGDMRYARLIEKPLFDADGARIRQ